MATKNALNTLGLVIQALAEKHDISKYAVRSILAELPDDILREADWKDLDAIVQEGLVKPGYTDEEETQEIKGGFF